MAFFDFEHMYFLINSAIIEKDDNCAVSDDSFYLSSGSKMCHW